jgi:hypothetical protein
MSEQWKEAIIVLLYKSMIKLTVVILEEHQCYQSHTKFYKYSSLKVNYAYISRGNY